MQDSSLKRAHGGARPGAGRPKRPPTLAGAMREQFPVEWICERARELAERGETDSVRLRALEIIAERAHGKVTERHEVAAVAALDSADDEALAESLTTEQLEALEALDEQRAIILARNANPGALTEGNGT